MADEALTNKEESREALSFIGRLVVIPLITGALISRAITDPVLSFSLQVRGAGAVRALLLGHSHRYKACMKAYWPCPLEGRLRKAVGADLRVSRAQRSCRLCSDEGAPQAMCQQGGVEKSVLAKLYRTWRTPFWIVELTGKSGL